MVERRLAGGLILLLVLSGSASAEHQPGLTLPEVIVKVQQAENAVQTLESRFRERIERRQFPADEIQGQLRYRKPRWIRVDQQVPDKQVAVTDGSRVRVYQPSAGQVIIGDWKQWQERSHLPSPLLDFGGEGSARDWNEHYEILFGGYGQGLYKLNFRPKDQRDLPLELWVSDETFLPVRGRLKDKGGVVDITFEGMRVNGPLSDELFKLRVPRGTVEVPMPS